jgi:hypothetical protein
MNAGKFFKKYVRDHRRAARSIAENPLGGFGWGKEFFALGLELHRSDGRL